MKTGTAVVLSRDELLKDLIPVFIQAGKDMMEDLVMGKESERTIAPFVDVKRKTMSDLVQLWADFCSEEFFGSNVLIDHILACEGEDEMFVDMFFVASRKPKKILDILKQK